jgi:glycosyltransferase involved in cell wall biosynthesis
MKKEKILIVYRGPLERTRLAFIFELINNGAEDIEFIGIFPGRLNSVKRALISSFLNENFSAVTILEDKWKHFFSTVNLLKQKIRKTSPARIVAIGFSSLVFLYPFKKAKITWFINGIPEEKAMHSKNFTARLIPKILWNINRLFGPSPGKIVTVSGRMSAYVSTYFSNTPVLHAPTCADLETFKSTNNKKGYFVYCGSGAPWQAIDLMKTVWDEIHRLDPAIKFRVISRDERCKVLGDNIHSENIEFVQSSDHHKVAEYLDECSLAFMLRRDDIVNRVCFPTKFAQYIASGCAVVTTDIDWDVKDYVTDEVGILVKPDDPPKKIAGSILSFYKDFKTHPSVIASHALKLGRKYWVEKIKTDLARN